MILATSNFSLNKVVDPDDFWKRVEAQIIQAKDAEIILFPEYFSLSWLVARLGEANFRKSLTRCNETLFEFKDRFKKLSQKHQVIIVAGTHPFKIGKKIINRCHVFFPNGKIMTQDKINMTRFEDEEWGVSAATNKINSFKYKDKNVAVLICYDSEFSNLSLKLAKQKIDLLLVPSCTDEIYGYWRVRHCCEARSIENQCYTVMSSIVGGNKKFPDINGHYGMAAAFGPCDHGFPTDGVLAESPKNREGILAVKLDFDVLKKVRKSGTVLNLRDSRKK